MQWGLYDTRDHSWIGDDKGPSLFDDEFMAKVAAMIADVRLGQPAGRIKAVKFVGGPVRKKSDHKAKCSALKALQVIEDPGGHLFGRVSDEGVPDDD